MQTTRLSLILLAVFSGVVGGVWFVLPKFIPNRYPKIQLITLDAAGIFIANLSLAYLFQQHVPPVTFSVAWGAIILYGVTQIVADYLIIYGFRKVGAQVGSLVIPIEAIFGTIYAYLLFQETLPPLTIAWGILILIGAMSPSINVSTWNYLTAITYKTLPKRLQKNRFR